MKRVITSRIDITERFLLGLIIVHGCLSYHSFGICLLRFIQEEQNLRHGIITLNVEPTTYYTLSKLILELAEEQ